MLFCPQRPNKTQGNERPEVPLHLQVSSVSPKALQLVEAAGGSVERVYYTRLGLKALLKVQGGDAMSELTAAWLFSVCVCLLALAPASRAPSTMLDH